MNTQPYSGSTTRTNLSASNFSRLLPQFEPISLAQMAHVALLERMDTKYVLAVAQLYKALMGLTEHYWVLDIEQVRLNHYQTLYFDTADFDLYMSHHAGRRQRYKVRSREYVNSHLSFLEIKAKTANNRTIKNRIQTPSLVTQLTSETNEFMNLYFPSDRYQLEPKLLNNFSRITLVSKQSPERLTLDLNLEFCNNQDGVTLPGVAIAEVKKAGTHHTSHFIQQMRAMNVHPTGFSKYCVGVSMLYPAIKHNKFKPKLQLVHQLMQGGNHVH